MKIANRLQNWVEQGLISQSQAEQILLSEKSNHSNIMWRWMYGIAGLFIGLGFILIIGANWDDIPAGVKLFGDFALWAGIIYAAVKSVADKKSKASEILLVLSFLFAGATIGLIGQIFNLNGGWHSFAMAWSLLGLPYVLFSRLLSFNFCWLVLFFNSFNFGFFEKLIQYIDGNLDGLVLAVIVLSLLSYAGKKADESMNKYTLLPLALQHLAMFTAYVCVFSSIFAYRDDSYIISFLAYVFAFLFFGVRMFMAVKAQDIQSFKRNAIAVEVYIFLIFASRFGNLMLSGFGFIFAGLAVLALIYSLRKTSKYIKTMEVFHG